MVMISAETWKVLCQKQAHLEQLIIQKNHPDSKNNSTIPPSVGVSRFNIERLKLCLLVEVGEFANEIKSFKAGRKKAEINGAQTKEELIDCLCFFLGLVGIYQIDMTPALFIEYKRKDIPFNELLLVFFAKTNDLYVEENEQFYNLENKEIKNQAKNTYYDGWKIFGTVCGKLQIDEPELIDIYSKKYDKNLERAIEK